LRHGRSGARRDAGAGGAGGRQGVHRPGGGRHTDIGGYVDLLTGPTDAEMFTRWSEWSALTPYFRVHNSPTTGERMPWSFDPQTYD
jgi:hypothetical protein